jgi:ribose 5-phosphate isomerase B
MIEMANHKGSLAIAADHAGYGLKEVIKAALLDWGIPCEDLGTYSGRPADYPTFAHEVANGVVANRFSLGILICGTGLGMSMAANRHSGIRAAVCSDDFSARMARFHNDANILCLGANVVGVGLAKDIVRTFLDTPFEGGRHISRIAKIEPETR